MTGERPLPEPEPRERAGASAPLLLATLVLSAFAAWALPGNRPGLGAVLVAMATAAVVASARPAPVAGGTMGYAGLALALASMAALRSAEWILAADALAAGVLATFAVVGGRTWAELGRAPLFAASRGPEALPYLARGVGLLAPGRKLAPAFRGIGFGTALVVVFGGLFVSADRAFADLARDFLLPDVDPALLPARTMVFVVVSVAATSLAIAGPRFAHLGVPWLMRAVPSAFDLEDRRPWRGIQPIEWRLALVLLDLLFVAFVGVQLVVLFGGHDYVLETAGLTYAQYAREGFFQLVVAAALTLAVVAGASRWARRRDPRDTRVLHLLLGVLLLLTLVVLASALKRLVLYEQAFGFTRLRISVHAVILWLAGLLLMVAVAGALRRGRWLPRAVVGFSAAALLVFNLANPDGIVARRNVERFQQTGQVDLAYLGRLSPDAFPALATLPSPLRGCVLGPHADLLAEPDSWPAWNLARDRGRAVLERTLPARCSP